MSFFRTGFNPGVTAAGAAAVPPPPPSLVSTITGGVKAYSTGGAPAAVSFAVSAATKALPGLGTVLGIGELFGFDIGSVFETKSKANWDRSLGRIFRATGQDMGQREVMRTLYRAWVEAGDTTGAQLWERIVDVFKLPTTKGGTKEGFTRGAPIFDETTFNKSAFESYKAHVYA